MATGLFGEEGVRSGKLILSKEKCIDPYRHACRLQPLHLY